MAGQLTAPTKIAQSRRHIHCERLAGSRGLAPPGTRDWSRTFGAGSCRFIGLTLAGFVETINHYIREIIPVIEWGLLRSAVLYVPWGPCFE